MKIVTLDSRTGCEFVTEVRSAWAGLVESLLEQNPGHAELEPDGMGVVVTDSDGHWRCIRPTEPHREGRSGA